jgi:hypothetical protein
MIGKRDWVTLGLILVAQLGLGICYWSTQQEYSALELPDAFVQAEAESGEIAPEATPAPASTAEPPLGGADTVVQADYEKMMAAPTVNKSVSQEQQPDPLPGKATVPSFPEIPPATPMVEPPTVAPSPRIEPTPAPPIADPGPATPPVPAVAAGAVPPVPPVTSAPPVPPLPGVSPVPLPNVDIPKETLPQKTESTNEQPAEQGKDAGTSLPPPLPSETKNPLPVPMATPLPIPEPDVKKPISSVSDPAPLPPLASPPVPTPKAEVKEPEPAKPCPWKLRLEIIKGRTHLTARTDKGAEFLIRCDELNMKRPLGNIEATGKVEIITRGHEGKCDKLAISWQEDRVELQGNASWKSRHQGEMLELNASQLSLRLSAVQAAEEAEASEPIPE